MNHIFEVVKHGEEGDYILVQCYNKYFVFRKQGDVWQKRIMNSTAGLPKEWKGADPREFETLSDNAPDKFKRLKNTKDYVPLNEDIFDKLVELDSKGCTLMIVTKELNESWSCSRTQTAENKKENSL